VKSKRSEDPAEDNGRQSSEKPSSTQQQFFPGELSSSRRSLPEGGGGGATHSIPKEPEDMLAQPRRVCSPRGSEARLAVKDPDVRSKEFDIRDEYKGQDDGTAAWAAGEATQGLEFGHGDGEHASVTPLRQKRFFKDLSPPKMSPPDSSDGPISPLQGGSEDRYLPTLPSVFGRGGK
jgi:hypothetical protein